jgi:hypothetical protein
MRSPGILPALFHSHRNGPSRTGETEACQAEIDKMKALNLRSVRFASGAACAAWHL